jgi:hypothetical protein
VRVAVWWFQNESGRSPAWEYITNLPDEHADAILAQVAHLAENWNAQTAVDEHGLANYSPMREIRYHDAGGQRVFYYVQDDQLWVLGASKKQDAEREMEQSYKRMKKVRAWMKEQKKKPKERR